MGPSGADRRTGELEMLTAPAPDARSELQTAYDMFAD